MTTGASFHTGNRNIELSLTCTTVVRPDLSELRAMACTAATSTAQGTPYWTGECSVMGGRVVALSDTQLEVHAAEVSCGTHWMQAVVFRTSQPAGGLTAVPNALRP